MRPIRVIASDLHMEYAGYAGYPQMWGDAYFATEQIFDYALKHDCGLILAGDLFDKAYPDSYSLKKMFEQLDRAREGGLCVMYVQGQHELSRRQPWMSLHDWPIHIHGRGVHIGGGRNAFGLDWTPSVGLKAALARCGEGPGVVNVLILHQVWKEFMGDICAPEGSLDELVPDHVDLVITGDFHRHCTELRKNVNGHEYRVLSPGSTTMQALNEDPVKFCFLLYDDSSIVSLPLKSRPVIYSRSVTEGQLDNELQRIDADIAALKASPDVQKLPENIQSPMLVAQFNHDIADAARRLRKVAEGRAHLFLRPFGHNREELVTTEKVVPGLEAALASIVEQNSPVYSTALRLIRAQDFKAELAAIVEEELRSDAEPDGF